METTLSMEQCTKTVGELVAEDYRRADVFRKYGIDFCCGGDRPLLVACEEQGISCEEISYALSAAESQPDEPLETHLDVRSWEPDFLASYVVNIHHRYVREKSLVLRELTEKSAKVHGSSHPELIRIAELTDELLKELAEHMEKEEKEYFPYVTRLCAAVRKNERIPEPKAGSVDVLEHEHDEAGDLIKSIRRMTNGFDPSQAPCNTVRLAFAELEKFEADLYRHVHLENNVLFPAAARLARKSIAADSAANGSAENRSCAC